MTHYADDPFPAIGPRHDSGERRPRSRRDGRFDGRMDADYDDWRDDRRDDWRDDHRDHPGGRRQDPPDGRRRDHRHDPRRGAGRSDGRRDGRYPERADARPRRYRPRDRRRRQSPAQAALSAATEVVVVLGMALALSLLIKTFLVQAFFIPSQSMEDTLRIGDRVVVSKLTPGPFGLHRGDIVVFKDPGGWLAPAQEAEDGGLPRAVRQTLTFVGLLPQDSGEHLIKRVIGLPGDTVVCCDASGRLSVAGVTLDEPYLFPGDRSSDSDFSATVPAGRFWVMGDHRSVSKDSRFNAEQFVPMDAVVGKAFVTVWPLDRVGGLGLPDSVFARVPDGAS